MKINELIKILGKLSNETITQSSLANIWCLTEAAISKRVKANSDITVEELIRTCKHYDICVSDVLDGKVKDSVEIKYYDNPKVRDIIVHSKLHNIWKDRELVHDIWGKNEKNLRVIKMLGDSMRTCDGDSINPSDILIIDTSLTNPLISGIYAFTTRGQSNIFIAIIMQNDDGGITFSYKNKYYESYTRSKEELEENQFEIIGKVIHNESKLI
jgi:predicted transcriptional regulator